MPKTIKTLNHSLIPKQAKVSEREKKEIFEKYKISFKELPKIKSDDPAIAHLKLLKGDIVKVIRESRTAGESVFYRGITDV